MGLPNFFIGTDGRVSIGMKPGKTLPSGNRGQLEVDGMIYSKNQPVMPSHVGQIIMSVTLDTAAKVQAIYGGTWVSWGAGRVPVGVNSSDSDFATVQKTGGEKSHTLTIAEMPSHKHPIPYRTNTNITTGSTGQWTTDPGTSSGSSDSKAVAVGGGSAHNNLQPYITVYMWRRTA